jgi:hypothetical protein
MIGTDPGMLSKANRLAMAITAATFLLSTKASNPTQPEKVSSLISMEYMRNAN